MFSVYKVLCLKVLVCTRVCVSTGLCVKASGCKSVGLCVKGLFLRWCVCVTDCVFLVATTSAYRFHITSSSSSQHILLSSSQNIPSYSRTLTHSHTSLAQRLFKTFRSCALRRGDITVCKQKNVSCELGSFCGYIHTTHLHSFPPLLRFFTPPHLTTFTCWRLILTSHVLSSSRFHAHIFIYIT